MGFRAKGTEIFTEHQLYVMLGTIHTLEVIIILLILLEKKLIFYKAKKPMQILDPTLPDYTKHFSITGLQYENSFT